MAVAGISFGVRLSIIYPPCDSSQKDDSRKTSASTAFLWVNYKQTTGCTNVRETEQPIRDGSRQPAAVALTHGKEKTAERYCFSYTYTYISFLLSPYFCFFSTFHPYSKTAVTRPSATERQQQQRRVSG